jgi:O-antigen/teichoic acid export membrane protein
MVGAILGPAAAGLYAVAIGIAEFIAMPGTANAPAVLYRVATANANAAPWGRFLTGRVATSACLSAVAAILVAATASFVVPRILGREFVGAINPLRLLCFSVVALSTLRLLRQANFALGETHRNWLGDLAAIAITVVGNLLFLRQGGLAVAAGISIVSNATAVGVLAVGLRYGSKPTPTVIPSLPLAAELIAHEAAP